MKTAINNNYHMKSAQRNDIFRKFQKPFRHLLHDSMHYDKSLYVEQSSTRYEEEFDDFTTSYSNEVRYFIGYTGCGKSTFIRHYFNLDNISPKINNDGTTLIIPSFWNGKMIDRNNFETSISEHIAGSVRAALKEIDKKEGLVFPYNDVEEFHDYVQSTRGDILATLSVEEYQELGKNPELVISRILTKTEQKCPIEFTSSSLKYFIEKYSIDINRVIFIIDDVETMNADELKYLVDAYYHIYDCFQNTKNRRIIANLLISLRPHSFRFLRDCSLEHEKIIAYGNHLECIGYQIIRNDIPDILEIFKKRFENVDKAIEPGNKKTWDKNKQTMFSLIDDIEKSYVDIITDLCHMNIRAIFDCLQLILSNRIWCQESKAVSRYPVVQIGEYNFNNIVNVLRTLSCGENSVYTGKMDVQFNANELENMQPRPSFDGSDVLIPNILNNIETRECDITSVYIMYYLENKFSSTENAPANSEFITVRVLLDDIMRLFNRSDREYLFRTIMYLFRNRIIRKSIKDHDAPNILNHIDEDTYIYLTKKGSRLLKLFREDSILLEIFREDIIREYANESICKSSFELVMEQNREILFHDLIRLAREIFMDEDRFVVNVWEAENSCFSKDFITPFKLAEDICQGLCNTFECAKNLVGIENIKGKLEELKEDIRIRKMELID